MIEKVREKARLQLGMAINDAKKYIAQNKTKEWQESVKEANENYLKEMKKVES